MFSLFEADKYQTPAKLLELLGQLRERDAKGNYVHDLSDMDVQKDPELDHPPWPNYQWRRFHIAVDWYGARFLGTDPQGNFLFEKQKVTDFDPIKRPTTGWWHNYFGDVEGIMRRVLTRACEVALGLSHGQPLPAVTAITRCWPIDFTLSCPAAWFEGWVCWRKTGPGVKEGHVAIHLIMPAHLHPNSPDGNPMDFRHPRDGGVLYSPLAPPQKGGPDYLVEPSAPTGNYGMWVITHGAHDMEPALLRVANQPDGSMTPTVTTSMATGGGQMPLPSWGLAYRGLPAANGTPELVCVQPAEADGGVLPQGRGN
jgi:hypothetical protein